MNYVKLWVQCLENSAELDHNFKEIVVERIVSSFGQHLSIALKWKGLEYFCCLNIWAICLFYQNGYVELKENKTKKQETDLKIKVKSFNIPFYIL